MKIELTFTITAIIALCSTISPILTAIVNNRYLRKIKELELRHEAYKESLFYKREIYEEYLRQASSLIATGAEDARLAYSKVYPLVLAYSPEETHSELIELNNQLMHITGTNRDKSIECLNNITPKIKKIIESF